MKIFIRKIPEDTKPEDLVKFFNPFLRRSLLNPLRAKGKLVKYSIVVQLDQNNNVVAHHGLVTILPEKVAVRILKRMHLRSIKGRKVIVREFINRTWHNDRRNHSSEHKISQINSRRISDRRQCSLDNAANHQINFSDQSDFSRKY